MSAVALVFLVAFLLVPLVAVVWRSFNVASLQLLVQSATWRTVLWATVQGVASTVLTFAIALPITGVLARYEFRGGGVTRALLTIPFVLPTIVMALAVRQTLPTGWGEGFSAVVITHALLNVAVVLWLVGTLWEQLDSRLEHVAASLGARPVTVFRTVTFPQLRPALLAAGALVFAYTTTSLGVVLVLGDQHTPTLELDIFRRTGVLVDLSGASVIALLQLVLVGTVLGVAAWLQGRLAHQVRRRTVAPRKTRPHGSMKVLVNVSQGLVRFKHDTTEAESCLATSWTISPDGLVVGYQFGPATAQGIWDDCNAKLAHNHVMIASFSRALTEGLKRSMSDAEFDKALGAAIDEIYKASVDKVAA